MQLQIYICVSYNDIAVGFPAGHVGGAMLVNHS